MVAVCEFKMPQKFEIAGKNLNDGTAKTLIDKIIDDLKKEKATLSRVQSYCDIDEGKNPTKVTEDATFVEINLILDEHQIQDYKIYDNLIIDKAISSFQNDDHYISKYWLNGQEEHIAFETEF
jgi:hypothetical protein